MKNPKSLKKEDSSLTPSFRKPFFIESFIKTANEIIKFYSSIHRARTYHREREPGVLGDKRWHLKFSDKEFWNFNSPKISRKEFNEIIKDKETYRDYARHVLVLEPDEIEDPECLDQEGLNNLYLKFVNNLEKDWLFHRLYFKVFYDIHQKKTILFLDLAAYCATRHVRFLTRRALNYLEGNYVISLRPKIGKEEEGKVYIPHLQFPDESVELLYLSHEGFNVEHVIADYFIKEDIKSIDQLLEKFDTIVNLKVDVAKEEKEHIFLKPSSYIDREVLITSYKKWLKSLSTKNINFRDRNSIIENLDMGELEVPENLFIKDSYVEADNFNYQSDRDNFLKDELRAKKWMVRSLFNDLLQYSINKIRFLGEEGKVATTPIEARTEYENIFREYKYLTFLEQDVGCLLVEDGEISFILLLWEYLEKPQTFDKTEKLIEKLTFWGLIEKSDKGFCYTIRAQRMAKWCMKLMGLKYKDENNKIDYNKEKIRRSYYNLIWENGFFFWMIQVQDKEKLVQLFGKIIFAKQTSISGQKISNTIKEIIDHFYNLQDDEIKKMVENSVQNSRFNKPLNQFLRSYETINRPVIAFPISTIPTDVEIKTRTFSTFNGTFSLDERLDSDDEDIFESYRRELTDMLNFAKIFFTLVGKPASESLNEAIIRNTVQEHLEFTLGRFAHKVKNEGVNIVARMDRLWKQVNEDKEKYKDISGQLLELKNGVNKFTGTIHILNIAANKFKPQYFEDVDYCIIDVVAEAYCNAFQHFYIGGKEEEADKLWSEEKQKFRTPILDLKLTVEQIDKKYIIEKKIAYSPQIKDINFIPPGNTLHVFNYYFDAYDILEDKSRLFVDKLPEKIIMHSPFFEMFTNAFTYMSKDEALFKIELNIIKKSDEIIVTVINDVDADYKIDDTTYQRIEESPGLQANKLFFENIGGSFKFDYDKAHRKAIAKAIINLTELQKF